MTVRLLVEEIQTINQILFERVSVYSQDTLGAIMRNKKGQVMNLAFASRTKRRLSHFILKTDMSFLRFWK